MGPRSNDWCLYKERERERERDFRYRHREEGHMKEGRDWSDATLSQECQE